MKIARADIVTAFDEKTIGTKVIAPFAFNNALEAAIEAYTFPANGQGFVTLPASAYDTVSPGVRRVEGLIEKDFVVRQHRGHWGCYAKRSSPRLSLVPVEGLACVVYTKDAYLADPDLAAQEHKAPCMGSIHEYDHGGDCPCGVLAKNVKALQERERITNLDPDYILVAVLAFCGPKSPLPLWTLVHNIAGGNNEFIPRTAPPAFHEIQNLVDDVRLLHSIIASAKASEAYWNEWMIVAD